MSATAALPSIPNLLAEITALQAHKAIVVICGDKQLPRI